MPSKQVFPVSISVVEAARNLALNESRQRCKRSATELPDDADAAALSLRKTTPRLAEPIAPDFEVDNAMLALPVAEVDYYDGNPRFDLGKDYADLKKSIRAEGGLISKLCVTRRPGGARYMVEAGGNRRLRALKELAAEDSRFRQEIFIYRTWRGESTVLLHHLAENMQRADMTLWEQASGVLRLKRQLEQERGEEFSLRGFNEELGKLGLAVCKSALSIYAFVVERLAPLGPAAQLLNFKSAEEFQRRFNQFAKLAAIFALDEQALYREVLTPTLEHAGHEYAERRDFKPNAVLSECEAALAQRLGATAPTLRQWLAVMRVNAQATREDLMVPCEAHADDRADAAGVETQQEIANASAQPIVDASDSAPVDPESPETTPPFLQACVLAFAREVGAADYLRWHEGFPAGFYVEIPDPDYAPGVSRVHDLPSGELAQAARDASALPLDLRNHQDPSNPHLYRGWWLLMQISGLIADASPCDLDAGLLERLPPDASWRRAMSLGYEEVDRVVNEITGERPDLAFVFDWLTAPGHGAGASLRALLEALREVRRGL